MITVSTKGRYALRALVDLALRNGEAPVARQDIARRQKISADYVAQLFGPLQAAGFVEGVKGPGGGYRLARNAEDIRVLDVVEVLEGRIALAPCVRHDEKVTCPLEDNCVTRPLWERLSKSVRELLDSYTLQDLCDEAEVIS